MSATSWLLLALGGLIAGGVFSALFHSLKEMTRGVLEALAQERGGSVARRVEKILEDADGHTTAVGLPRILAHMLVALAMVFAIALLRTGAAPAPLDAALGIVAGGMLVWLFGLVIPHSVAAYAAERTVCTWSSLIRACYILQLPLIRVVRFSDEAVRRLAGRQATDAEVIEAELMSVVEEGQEEGQFDEREREMIEAVVDFRKITVVQIMTPRTEIEALELTNNLGEITRFIRQSRHSRIPVYEGSLDHVVGMFYIKDLMRWLAGERGSAAGQASATQAGQANRPFDLRSILRPAIFVPETKTIRELLTELLRKKVHVAMVADEYGGTAGLVTLEDIVEEIFGEIQDEYEQGPGDDAPEVHVDAEARAADIDGRAYIHDANEALRPIGVELPESEDYDTVGGLVVTRLGRIPGAGDTLEIEGATITVTEAAPTRVGRIRIEATPEEGEGQADAGAEAAGEQAAVPMTNPAASLSQGAAVSRSGDPSHPG